MAITLAETLDQLSIPEPNSGCWIWFGAVNGQGYGNIGRFGKSLKAHRVSWQVNRGPIPRGKHVLHRCDMTCCINPDHLFIGTASDNMLDMYSKGRHKKVRLTGTDHPGSKLTEADALYILSTPKHTRGLAQKFGVSNSRISSVRKGLTWKHLQPKGI